MPTARDNVAAAAWEGKLYVLGGRSGTLRLNTVEVYDPQAIELEDKWKELAPMPTAVSHAGAAAVNVIGGQNSSGTLDNV